MEAGGSNERLRLAGRNSEFYSTGPGQVKVSSDTSKFRYTYGSNGRHHIRIARIVSEMFRLGLEDVRWFVMGDDDTVFVPGNFAKVLANTAAGGLYSADARIHACVAELGVPLTVERGFHQFVVLDDASGLLSSHPLTPLVSLHHIELLDPFFPRMGRIESVKHLIGRAQVDPMGLLQQSFCYDPDRDWTIKVSWGFVVQIHQGDVPEKDLELPVRTISGYILWVATVIAWESPSRRERTRWTSAGQLLFDPVNEAGRRGVKHGREDTVEVFTLGEGFIRSENYTRGEGLIRSRILPIGTIFRDGSRYRISVFVALSWKIGKLVLETPQELQQQQQHDQSGEYDVWDRSRVTDLGSQEELREALVAAESNVVSLDSAVRDMHDGSLPPLQVVDNNELLRNFTLTGQQMKDQIRVSRLPSELFRLKFFGVRRHLLRRGQSRPSSLQVRSQFYYIGAFSESHYQSVTGFSTNMAFGGAGIALSYSLVKALEKMQDDCIRRNYHVWGVDGKLQACMAELGVPLTLDRRFHQMDIRGDAIGLLDSHPTTPLVSLHHLDTVDPIFPGMNRIQALAQLSLAIRACRLTSVFLLQRCRQLDAESVLGIRRASSCLNLKTREIDRSDPCLSTVSFFMLNVSQDGLDSNYFKRTGTGSCEDRDPLSRLEIIRVTWNYSSCKLLHDYYSAFTVTSSKEFRDWQLRWRDKFGKHRVWNRSQLSYLRTQEKIHKALVENKRAARVSDNPKLSAMFRTRGKHMKDHIRITRLPSELFRLNFSRSVLGFSTSMAFGGAGTAMSYALVEALEKIQDDCIRRSYHVWGVDGKLQACMAELDGLARRCYKFLGFTSPLSAGVSLEPQSRVGYVVQVSRGFISPRDLEQLSLTGWGAAIVLASTLGPGILLAILVDVAYGFSCFRSQSLSLLLLASPTMLPNSSSLVFFQQGHRWSTDPSKASLTKKPAKLPNEVDRCAIEAKTKKMASLSVKSQEKPHTTHARSVEQYKARSRRKFERTSIHTMKCTRSEGAVHKARSACTTASRGSGQAIVMTCMQASKGFFCQYPKECDWPSSTQLIDQLGLARIHFHENGEIKLSWNNNGTMLE
ncbi:hypothetical protein SELMODRAFT_430371 [Selaginella moellendorffii]|uniref:Uncharacterized protein n=1 Tax=Selaginella moellendorffii TaxID=88036 RepID=D8T975_SELML|nr:hypothetical protein SELMODRAFT_430371 [Selaginella moellendorffii]